MDIKKNKHKISTRAFNPYNDVEIIHVGLLGFGYEAVGATRMQ